MGGHVSSARRYVGMLILVAALPLTVCQGEPDDHSTPVSGSAIQVVAVDTAGIVAIPPGASVTVLLVPIANISATPLTVEAVSVMGPGLGHVVRIVQTHGVPDASGTHSFPSGVFSTYPPVFEIDGVCHSPELLPLKGTTVDAGERVRVLFVVEAQNEGSYASNRQIVTYRQGGTLYQQEVSVYFRGRVNASSTGPKTDPAEKPCIEGT